MIAKKLAKKKLTYEEVPFKVTKPKKVEKVENKLLNGEEK